MPEPTIPEAPLERVLAARELGSRAPVPAQVGIIRCGTAGWTDPTLVQAGFYPPAARTPADRLTHYTRHFSMVEVDASFYAIPSPQTSTHWVERTPPDFVFDIKAHPILTGHPIDRTRLPKELAAAVSGIAPSRQRVYPRELPQDVRSALIDSFRAFIQPLRDAAKLGCVMVQLPPWITATRGAVRELEALPSLLPGTTMAVEFRHPSWLEEGRRDRVFEMLRAHGLGYVVVDEPNVLGGGVPPVPAVTRDDLAVVRFHGQNVAGWRPGATVLERFNYLYSPEQLALWVAPVRELAAHSSQVHAVFNNCVRDYAVLGAKDLAALLNADRGIEARDGSAAVTGEPGDCEATSRQRG